jgi:hypothetical protein
MSDLTTVRAQLEAAARWTAVAQNTLGALLPALGQRRGETITVGQGGHLQAALDAAQPGDTVRVYPGTYPSLTLRAKTPFDTRPITIAPDTDVLQAGQRIDPSYAPALITLQATDGKPPLRSDHGAGHYVLRGFRPLSVGDGTASHALVGDPQARHIGCLPADIVLDQWLVQGSETVGGKRGIEVHGGGLAVCNSHVSGFWRVGQDNQAIFASNGPGPYSFVNNFLEAAGMSIMLGGDDSRAPWLAPGQLLVRGNHLTKNVAWKVMIPAPQVKNVFELKTCFTALIEDNLMEYSWSGAQDGYVVVLSPRNQYGNAPWSGLADLTLRYNVFRHAGAGLNLMGDDNLKPSQRTAHVRIEHNLLYGIDRTLHKGAGRLFLVQRGCVDTTIAHNTALGANLQAAVYLDGTPKHVGLAVHDNVLSEGGYGLWGSNAVSCEDAWARYVERGQCANNLWQKGPGARLLTYPGPGNLRAGEVVADDFSLLEPHRGFLTSDGQPVGCDLAELRRRVRF